MFVRFNAAVYKHCAVERNGLGFVVGGPRVSTYNGVPYEGIRVLDVVEKVRGVLEIKEGGGVDYSTE